MVLQWPMPWCSRGVARTSSERSRHPWLSASQTTAPDRRCSSHPTSFAAVSSSHASPRLVSAPRPGAVTPGKSFVGRPVASAPIRSRPVPPSSSLPSSRTLRATRDARSRQSKRGTCRASRVLAAASVAGRACTARQLCQCHAGGGAAAAAAAADSWTARVAGARAGGAEFRRDPEAYACMVGQVSLCRAPVLSFRRARPRVRTCILWDAGRGERTCMKTQLSLLAPPYPRPASSRDASGPCCGCCARSRRV